MKEHAVEKHLRLRTQELGGWALKFVSPGNAGVPDRLTILPHDECPHCKARARIGFVELKAPGQRPRPLQVRQGERLARLGAFVAWADTPDRVDEVLEDLLQGPGMQARQERSETLGGGLVSLGAPGALLRPSATFWGVRRG